MDALFFFLSGHIFLKATVVVGTAWLVVRYVPSLSAAQRHAVWSLAFISLLLVPVVTPFVPAWHVDWLASFERGNPGRMIYEGGDMVVGPELEAAAGATADDGERSGRSAAGGLVGEQRANTGSTEAESLSGLIERISLSRWLLALWLAGAVFVLGQLALGLVSIYRITRRAEPFDTTAFSVDELAGELAVSQKVRLVCSGRIQVPMVWGLMQSTVLLPEEAQSWSAQRLRVVLLHELAHVQRRDYLVHLVAQCARALFWPNPLVWLAGRRLYAEQEQACDDHVLRQGTASYEYAEHLLEIVRSFRRRGPVVEGAMAMGRAQDMKERMQALLSSQADRSPLTWQVGLTITGLGCLLLLPVAALQVGAKAVSPTSHSYVWLEAERDNVPASMVMRSDTAAASDQYVAVEAGAVSLDNPPDERMQHSFDVPTAGAYLIWARVLAPDDDADSFWVRVDDGDWVRWNGIETGDRWVWNAVHDADRNGDVVLFDLEAGSHTIEVAHREDGIALDRLLVTDNTAYRPRGLMKEAAAAQDGHVWLEAEEGWLQSPMRVHSDHEASDWRYLEAAAKENSYEQPPRDGRASYSFAVDKAGSYYVWARVLAPHDNADSFWIRVDDGDWVRWNRIRHSHRWIWDDVHDADHGGESVVFDLEAGIHTLEVAYREEDARLDKFLITRDPHYHPRGYGDQPQTRTSFVEQLPAADGTIHAPMQAVTTAAGRQFVEVPAGSGRGGSGHVEIPFSVPDDSDYVLWGRVNAPDGQRNSFYVSVDGGEEVEWHIPASDDWSWEPVGRGSADDSRVQIYRLEPGQHTLRVRNREDGTQLEQLVVTNTQRDDQQAFWAHRSGR